MSKRLRFLYRYFVAVIRKNWKLFSLGFLILVLITLFFTSFTNLIFGSSKQTAKRLIKPTFYEAIVGKPTTFNPLFSKLQSEKEINSLVFRGLTKLDKDGKIIPDLAEKWQINDKTNYTFYLQKNINWQDGKKFTADDVVYTVETSQNPLYQSELAGDFKDVKISKVDDYTVKFKLKETFAPFLSSTSFGVIPKHIPLNDYRPIGTSNFKLVDLKNDSATLESNSIKLTFKYYPTLETALTAVKLGEVHALAGDLASLSSLKNWKTFQVDSLVLPYQLVVAIFNLRNAPLNEKPVRQALAYASPKEEIVNSSFGKKGNIAVNSLPFNQNTAEKAVDKYAFNLEKAGSLLTTAGWDLVGGIRTKAGKKLTVTVTTLADQEFEDTALKLKKSWEKLGIQVDISAVSGIELKDQIVPNRSFSVLLTSQLLGTDPDQYVLWHTTQTKESNVSSIALAKLDKLLEDGRKNLEPATRADRYQEFTRILLDESPAVFLYYPNYVWAHSKRVQNINLSNFVTSVSRFNSINSWQIKNPLF